MVHDLENLKPGARFHEALAVGWSNNYKRRGFLRRIEFIDSRLDRLVQPGAHWLDLGCGSGVLTKSLSDLGATGEAVDGSPSMIEAARRAPQAGNRHGFEYKWVETVESLDYPDASYHGILCSSVIEYVDDPVSVLDEIARLLKPGGKLLISFANSHSPVRLFQHAARGLGRVLDRKFCSYLDASHATFTRSQITRELLRRDFSVETLEGFDPILPPWLIKAFPGAGTLVFAIAIKKES